MNHITNAKRLTLLFALTYLTSYLTRINYGAIISEMVFSTGISKPFLSMALTGSFITYGIGQIISGALGDRVRPKLLIRTGFIITVIMNTLFPFSPNAYVMTAIWCVNGFAHSLMWPPLVRMMTALMTVDEYKAATVRVSWGAYIGTILVYLCSPLIIESFGWKYVFFISAVCGAVMLVLWQLLAPDVISEKRQVSDVCSSGISSKSIFVSPALILIFFAIICQGALKDGVTTWMPSYISETFKLESSTAILSGVVLPIFSILSTQAALTLHSKALKNPVVCAIVIFTLGSLSALVLALFSNSLAVLSIVFSAALTGCMHGVNLMYISMLPAYFKSVGKVSFASGLLNSFSYVGSAVSTYGIAVLSESRGWSFTITAWLVVALLGTAASILALRPWNKLNKYLTR